MRVVANKLTENKAQYSSFRTTMHDELDIDHWKVFLKDKIGMSPTALRPTYLFNCLTGRMNTIGIDSFQQYYDYLQSGEQGECEWQKLVDILTVHETWFYRHPPSLELLQNYVINKTGIANSARPISGWSVGCATGEEAYTLVMLIDSILKNKNNQIFYHVLASDISQSCLDFAHNGYYTEKQIKKLPPELYNTYFNGPENNRWQIDNELKKHTTFKSINLCDFNPNDISKMDFIFCQNVLIYFDKQDRINILSNLCDCLMPGGLLVLGAGEINQWSHKELEQIKSDGVLAYRKKS